jgi:SAP domain
MAPQVITVESEDPAIKLLQLAKVLPTTVLLDEVVDIPEGETATVEHYEEKYTELLEHAEEDTSVAEVGPERNGDEATEEEGPPEASPSSEPDFGTGSYEDRTVAQLRALAASKGLPTSGTKDELIERLRS